MVLAPRLLDARHARGLVAAAHLGEAELGPRLAVVGIELRRLLHHRDDVVVAMLPLGILADDAVEPGKLGVPCEDLLLRGFEAAEVVVEETRRGPEAEELEVVGIDGEAFGDGLLCGGDLHVVERDSGADGERTGVLRVDGERLLHELLALVEVEALIELHAREHHEDVGALGGDGERVLELLFGVTGVVLVEEQLGRPEQRLDALLVGVLALLERGVGVLRAAKQERGATDLGVALGIGRGDRAVVVVVDDLVERIVGVGALAHVDQVLAEEETRASHVGALRRRRSDAREQLDGVGLLAGGGEHLGTEHGGLHLVRGRRHRGLRVLVGVGVLALLERGLRETELRVGFASAFHRSEVGLRGRVVTRREGCEAGAERSRGRRAGLRGRSGLSGPPEPTGAAELSIRAAGGEGEGEGEREWRGEATHCRHGT